ncbi:tetratricopeptide repeat protein [Rhodanobacter terrae]|uniref:protein O-GlcNAc transferase n=1 Tax=Rhodanobacter terrae TaxID=418647 RepID=A0ABW0SV88_9GAMM
MNAASHLSLDVLLERLTSLIETTAYAEAAELAEDALPRFPDSAELLRIYAIALHQIDRREDALGVLYRAEKLSPDNLQVQCNLASLEIAEGHADEAIERMRAALRRAPGSPMILLILGNALMAAARYAHARESYSMATHGAPNHPGLRLNLAAAELEIGHPEQCAIHAKEALQIAPAMGGAHAMLGHSYRRRGRYAEAAQAFLRAEQLEPAESEHPYHAALALDDLDRLDDAQKAYARALQLNNNNGAALSQRVFTLRRLCDWSELDLLSARLRAAVARDASGITPFGLLAEDASAEEQCHCAKTFATAIDAQMASLRRQLAFTHAVPAANAPIRVGFVSNGFGEHATGLLIVAMLEALKSSDLEIHLYATAPNDGGAIRQRLEAACTVHEVAGMNHAAQAQRIHADSIEVLIDLSVYCEGANPKLFALRPAPLQVNWLGYPGTSGAAWMDYMLADAVVQPDHLRATSSEKLVRLPRCFQPSDTSRALVPAPAREHCGLPAQGTVFACFNASYKINPQAFSRFTSILAQTRGSVLWLLSSPEGANQRLRDQALQVGIAAERLIFMPKLPHAEYLSRYQHVDLFLDTLPYNAHTTASDALWAGCPVLTCAGETFAGRVAASLLRHAGLPELVAADETAFVTLAVSLGGNHEALQLLRQHLEQQRTSGSLFDMDGYSSDFRRAVQAMATRRRIGRPAADIDIQ